MKQLILIILSFIILSSGCRKNKNPVDQLPPETQIGANTFGCIVNGQVFKPGGAQLTGGSLQCNFQNLGSKGYYFVLIGRRKTGGGNTQTSVGVFTDSLKIHEGIKYVLARREKGKASADYYGTGDLPLIKFVTDGDQQKGELFIKKLDTLNQIASGTFWFDAVNANGQIVQIRDGRFDVRYTR